MNALSSFLDTYGEVRPDSALPAAIADTLLKEKAILMSWCDGHGTRLTVLFSLPQIVGHVPGLGGRTLYVSAEGFGSYGFVVRPEVLHPDYVAEKIGRRDVANPTWVALADLISQVRILLAAES